jgi:hypothetical protein
VTGPPRIVWKVFRIDPHSIQRISAPVPVAYDPVTPLIAFGSGWVAPGPAAGGLFRIRLH